MSKFGKHCVICDKVKEPEQIEKDKPYCLKCQKKWFAYSPYKAVNKK